jgi:hypothetical protein
MTVPDDPHTLNDGMGLLAKAVGVIWWKIMVCDVMEGECERRCEKLLRLKFVIVFLYHGCCFVSEKINMRNKKARVT